MSKPPSRTRLRVMQVVYDLVYVLLLLAGSPFVLLMLLISRKWRSGIVQRLGFCWKRQTTGPAILIHGVSAGEILAARELVKLIDAELPGLEVVLSTTTITGREAARSAYVGKQVVVFPLDFSFTTSRVLERVRPSLVLLMELELWPNFLLATTLRDIPVLLANGRMSEKSARDYLFLQRFIPEPMDRVTHYCVQSEEYARRFTGLGVPAERLTITGSMKFDNVADNLPEEIRAGYARRFSLQPGAFVLIGGSTHPGEETVILDAFLTIRGRDPSARLILCPRHPDPERLPDIEAQAASRGLHVVRLSATKPDAPPAAEVADAVILIDTVGELGRLYSVADLVFVGGSLISRRGGQSMIEPAGLGKPVVVGPNTWNFRDPVELLLTHGALRQVPDAEAVKRELVALHADPEARAELGRRAREVCLESKGATRRILEILQDYVPGGAPRSGDVDGVHSRYEGSSP